MIFIEITISKQFINQDLVAKWLTVDRQLFSSIWKCEEYEHIYIDNSYIFGLKIWFKNIKYIF